MRVVLVFVPLFTIFIFGCGWFYKNIYVPPMPSCTEKEEIGQCLVRTALDQNALIFSGTRLTILAYGDDQSLTRFGTRLHTMFGNNRTPLKRTWYFDERYDGKIYESLIETIQSGKIRYIVSTIREEMDAAATRRKLPEWAFPGIIHVLLSRGRLDDAVAFIKGTQDISLARFENDKDTITIITPNRERKSYLHNSAHTMHVLSLVCVALIEAGRMKDAQDLMSGLPADSYYFDRIQKDDFLSFIFGYSEEGMKYLEVQLDESLYLIAKRRFAKQMAGNAYERALGAYYVDQQLGAPWHHQQIRDPFLFIHAWDKPEGDQSEISSFELFKWIKAGEEDRVVHEIVSQPDTQHRAKVAANIIRYLAYTRSKNHSLVEQIWHHAMAPCWEEKTGQALPWDWQSMTQMQCHFYLLPQVRSH